MKFLFSPAETAAEQRGEEGVQDGHEGSTGERQQRKEQQRKRSRNAEGERSEGKDVFQTKNIGTKFSVCSHEGINLI
jgi:hypothetical protein